MSKQKHHVDKPILTEPEETAKEVVYKLTVENQMLRRKLTQMLKSAKDRQDGHPGLFLETDFAQSIIARAEFALYYTSEYHDEQNHLYNTLKHIGGLCQHAGDEYADQALADIGAIIKEALEIERDG